MALNGLILDQRNNTSKNWRNILAEIMEDGIFRDGCEITFTSNSITVGGGYFIQRGAVIENDGAETIPITPTLTNGYVRLICRVDLTKEATETGPGQVEWATDFSATSTFPALVQEDILQAGSVYEIEVAVLQITSGNVTAITRKIGGAEIDAERFGGQLPAHYATKAEVDAKIPLAKLSENTSGNITAASGNIYFGRWQKRNGWVRLSMYCTGATVSNGGVWFQIVGAGLPLETKFTGTCVLQNGSQSIALVSITTGGTMTVENANGSAMTGMIFDVTLPVQNP